MTSHAVPVTANAGMYMIKTDGLILRNNIDENTDVKQLTV